MRNRMKLNWTSAAALLVLVAVAGMLAVSGAAVADKPDKPGKPGGGGDKNVSLSARVEITDTTFGANRSGISDDANGFYIHGVEEVGCAIDSGKGSFSMDTTANQKIISRKMVRWVHLDFAGARLGGVIPLPVKYDGGLAVSGVSMGSGRRELTFDPGDDPDNSDDDTYTSTGLGLNILLMAPGAEAYTTFNVDFGFVNGDGDVERWYLTYDNTTLGELRAKPVKVTAGPLNGDGFVDRWTITSVGNAVLEKKAVGGNWNQGGDPQIVDMPMYFTIELLP